MKKNGQYVGVDEKYIPEEEKYVDNTANSEIKDGINKGVHSAKEYLSDKDNQEKLKKTGKKGLKILKGVGIGYLAFIGIIIVMVVVVFVIVFSTFGKINNKVNNNSNNVNEQINNVYSDYDKAVFNNSLELYSGTQLGSSVSFLLDNAVSSVKKDTKHTINVVFGEINTTKTDEITSLKKQFDATTKYEVSLDYDSDGFVNKITITNF